MAAAWAGSRQVATDARRRQCRRAPRRYSAGEAVERVEHVGRVTERASLEQALAGGVEFADREMQAVAVDARGVCR